MDRIRSTSTRSIVFVVALTLAASAVFQIHSYQRARRMEEIGRRDAHVRGVLAALAVLRSATQDAIIGRNGYSLSGNAASLNLYRTAADRIPQILHEVGDLTTNEPAQAELVRQLEPLVDDELTDLAQSDDTAQQQSDEVRASASNVLNTRWTLQIRQILDAMTDQEQQVRASDLEQTRDAASTQARALLIASAYRVFVLIGGCTLILRQQARQRRTERLLRQSEEFFRNAFVHAATGIALANASGRWVRVNRALCELLGYAPQELLQIAPTSITLPEELAKERAAIEHLIAGNVDSHQLETCYIHKSGHPVWAVVTRSLVRDEKGRPQTFISQIQDVTERKRAEDQLRHQSQHDALTGLPNRLLLDERIRRGLERASKDPEFRMAVLFLDLDRFKLINDSLGHAAGDKLLITIAQRLRGCVRGSDWLEHTVARLAGDEFTVLLEGFRSPADAERVAQRILDELSGAVDIDGRQIHAGASIGIVHASGCHYATASQVLADADAALYTAKAAGRGRYAVYDASAQESAVQRLRLAGELRRALEHEQFVLHYQPIVSLIDRRVVGFETLLRWNHPDRGMLASDQFIDLADEAGLTVPLGNWVLQQSSQQLAGWKLERETRHRPQLQPGASSPAGGADPFFIVAFSCKQLVDHGLAQRVRDLQRQHALQDGWLRVTIPEPVLMQNPEGVNAILAELRSAGARAWLDNFGSGVTALSCLRSTVLDGLKIDGRSVESPDNRRESAAIIHSVLELARNLRLQVIAGGLETAEQVTMLQAMGCELGQGSYFGEPLLAAEAGRSLDACLPSILARSA